MHGHTDEQIIKDLRDTAQEADSPSQNDYEAKGTIGLTTVRNHFGTWNQAVAAARLTPIKPGPIGRRKISDEESLADIIRLTQLLGKSPTESEINAQGNFSVKPYRDRWESLKLACKQVIAIQSSQG